MLPTPPSRTMLQADITNQLRMETPHPHPTFSTSRTSRNGNLFLKNFFQSEISLFPCKMAPILKELGSFCLASRALLTLTSWLPEHCYLWVSPTSLTTPSASLLPLCVLQIQALWDSSPFSLHHPQGCGPSHAPSDTPGQQQPLTSVSSSCLGSVPLVAAPARVHPLHPRTRPSASSLASSLATVALLLTHPPWLPIACHKMSKLLCLSFKALHVCPGSLQPPLLPSVSAVTFPE